MKDTPSGLERVLQGQSLGFILLKCQQVLKGAGRCMSTFDLQAALVHATGGQGTKYGQDYYRQLFTDPTFISVLRKNARLDFDQKTRRWSFKSPFGDYTGKDALLQGISKEQDGLEVSAELVEYHPLMADWIHQLLEAKLIRAVRAAKPTRCKYFSPESGFVCDLYEPKASKCDNCSVLKGLILYPRVPENIEAHDIFLDDDLRESWAAINLPKMEAILEQMKIKNQLYQLESKNKSRRKLPGRLAASAINPSGRVNKIVNLHIYTLDEFKAELSTKPESKPESKP